MKKPVNPVLSYVIGFALSAVLTLNAYIAVMSYSGRANAGLITLLVGLAVGQLLVQTIFFLHLGRESKPRWNSIAYATMIMVVLFIVVGSIWVMNNLNYNMMGEHTEEMIIQDEGLHR